MLGDEATLSTRAEMSLAFIAGYRDRDMERVKRSLDSLKNQTCRDFEMILVDYGSSSDCSSAIRSLAGNYNFCRYCYSDTRGWMWNRSAALNTGARHSNREFLFLTDVDIVYPPWFVERLIHNMARDVCLISECFRSPPGFDNWESVTRRGDIPQWSSMKGQGLICVAKKALESVGGLDEQYGFWGPEDKDFVERLNRNLVPEYPLSDLYCYHQWHPHVIYELPLIVQFNNLVRYYGSQSESRVRANERREWGKQARFEDRPIYTHIDPELGVPRPGAPIRTIEAFGIASVLTTITEIATTQKVLWALPKYNASDRNAYLVNKVLRRFGWRLDRRLGYAGDVAQGLFLTVPGLFRDCYLDSSIGARSRAFFLT